MKFKGQGEINICGFEYKKNIADSRGGGGGGCPSTQKKTCIRACRRGTYKCKQSGIVLFASTYIHFRALYSSDYFIHYSKVYGSIQCLQTYKYKGEFPKPHIGFFLFDSVQGL